MSQSDALLIIMAVLPLVILSLRRHSLTYLLSVVAAWALWIIESWEREADNNWGAATIAIGWFPVALYCALCYMVIALSCWIRRRVRRVGP